MATVESPAGSGVFVSLPTSKLTLTGDLSDGIRYQPSFDNGTGGLTPANSRTYNGGATRGRITVPYTFGNTSDRLQIYYPDNSSPVNLIYDTDDVAAGGPGAVTGPGLATVSFGSATSTGTRSPWWRPTAGAAPAPRSPGPCTSSAPPRS